MGGDAASWLNQLLTNAGGERRPLRAPNLLDDLATTVKNNQRGVLSALGNLMRQLEALKSSQELLAKHMSEADLGMEITIIPTTIHGLIEFGDGIQHQIRDSETLDQIR